MSTLFSLATPTSLRAHGGSDPWVWMVKESLDRDYALHNAVMTSGAATVASYAVKLAQGRLHFPLQYQFSFISPLHLAVFRNRLDLVRVLCSHRATAPLTRAPDRWHRTPLVYAAIEGNVEIAACLIEHGADVNPPSGPTPLHVACAARGGTVDARRSLVELLLMCRANAGDAAGDTVVHAALEPQDDLSVVLVATLVRALGARALRAPSKTRAAGITPMHLLLAAPWRDPATQLAALRAVIGVLASLRDDDGPAAIAAAAGVRETDPFLVADDIGHTPWMSLIGWVNTNPTPAALAMVAAILHARMTLEQINQFAAMNVNQAMPTSFWPGLHGMSPMTRRMILRALGDADGPQSPVPMPAPAPQRTLTPADSGAVPANGTAPAATWTPTTITAATTGASTAPPAPPPVPQRIPTDVPAGSMTTNGPARSLQSVSARSSTTLSTVPLASSTPVAPLVSPASPPPPPSSSQAPSIASPPLLPAPPLISPAEMHSKFRDAAATAMQAAWQRQSDLTAPVPSYALYSAPPSTYPASLLRPPTGMMPVPITAAAGGMVPTTTSGAMTAGLVAYYPGAYRPPPAYHAALRPSMTGTKPLPATTGAAMVPPTLVGAIRPPSLVGAGRPPSLAATMPPPSPAAAMPTPSPVVTAAGVPLPPRPRHDPQRPPELAVRPPAPVRLGRIAAAAAAAEVAPTAPPVPDSRAAPPPPMSDSLTAQPPRPTETVAAAQPTATRLVPPPPLPTTPGVQLSTAVAPPPSSTASRAPTSGGTPGAPLYLYCASGAAHLIICAATLPRCRDRRSSSSEMVIPLPPTTLSPANDSAPIATRSAVEMLLRRPSVPAPVTAAADPIAMDSAVEMLRRRPSVPGPATPAAATIVTPANASIATPTVVVPDSEPSIELTDLDIHPPLPVHSTGTATTAPSRSKSRRRPSKITADPTYDPSSATPAPPSSTRSKRSKMPADLIINPGDIVALLPDPHQARGDPAWLAIAGSKHLVHYASQGKAKVSLRYLKRALDQSNAPDGTVAYRVLRRLDRVPISQLMPAHPGPIFIARPHADSPALVAPTSAFDPAMARAYVHVEDEARAFETARELTDAAAAGAGVLSEARPSAAAAAVAAEPAGGDDEMALLLQGGAGDGDDGHDEGGDGIVVLDETAQAVVAQPEVRHHGNTMGARVYGEGIFGAGWRPHAPATQAQQHNPPLIMRLPKRARSASLDAAAAASTPPRPAKRRDVTEGETATPLPARTK
ncbi:hypothetical protein AMAG_03611 [Allomyces macrogynus ATCC 38327]|uniref:Uncharacterized protein n=1 Tax=Allomyces macrogynus (strain ATCC 38327) TaxID=578462 RepID=A0A0L0SA12_ALLM3|nr:hypothetical protein AMAG_03611 [Allomyces macrogynus ATCC 38327]|eukprot:KNE59306.1 hypothetical protein AMAG_03611 [Allomyces macrogynus ATCC 38327]